MIFFIDVVVFSFFCFLFQTFIMLFLVANQSPANQHHTKRPLNQNTFCFEHILLV